MVDRRKLIKQLSLGGGVVTLTKLPTVWIRPEVSSVVLPAHAQTTTYGTPITGVSYSQSSLWSSGVTPATESGMTNGITNEASQTGTDNDLPQEWIKMDLGMNYQVCQIVVGADFTTELGDDDWGPSYAGGKRIEYSSDNVNWSIAVNTTGVFNISPIKVFDVSINARYIRIIDVTGDYVAVTEFYAVSC